jgi:hypothetical protein
MEINMKQYTTQVVSYGLDDQTSVLGFEVPEELMQDLQLKENEILQWEVDPESQTATITKTKIIINPTKQAI